MTLSRISGFVVIQHKSYGFFKRALCRLRLYQKSWVVIPDELRKKDHLEAGMKLAFFDFDGMITLVPIPDDPVEAGYGLLAGEGLSLVEALLQERQWEREKEAAGMVKVLWSGA